MILIEESGFGCQIPRCRNREALSTEVVGIIVGSPQCATEIMLRALHLGTLRAKIDTYLSKVKGDKIDGK